MGICTERNRSIQYSIVTILHRIPLGNLLTFIIKKNK